MEYSDLQEKSNELSQWNKIEIKNGKVFLNGEKLKYLKSIKMEKVSLEVSEVTLVIKAVIK